MRDQGGSQLCRRQHDAASDWSAGPAAIRGRDHTELAVANHNQVTWAPSAWRIGSCAPLSALEFTSTADELDFLNAPLAERQSAGQWLTPSRPRRRSASGAEDCRWSLLDLNHAMHSACTRPHPWRRRRLPCPWRPIPVVVLPVLQHPTADPSGFERRRPVQRRRWRWRNDPSTLVAGRLSRGLHL